MNLLIKWILFFVVGGLLAFHNFSLTFSITLLTLYFIYLIFATNKYYNL